MSNPWSSIETPMHEFNVRLVSDKHSIPLYWGKDVRGGYLFIAQASSETPLDKKALPDLAGIRIAVAKSRDCIRLVLLLNEVANWEIFKALCFDLIRASKNAKNDAVALSCITRRLLRWQEFLKKERTHLLSSEAIKGLIGELLFLKEKLAPRFGWDLAVSFWKGPLDSPQDFAVHDTAVEVKCQAGSTKPYIPISSMEQMDAQLPFFYLAVYTLATADSGSVSAFTLNSLIEKIRNELLEADENTTELFETLLFRAGYVQFDNYNAPCFSCVAIQTFRVTELFPRLTPATAPDGISKVSYQISLDACAPFECELKFNQVNVNDN